MNKHDYGIYNKVRIILILKCVICNVDIFYLFICSLLQTETSKFHLSYLFKTVISL